MRSDENVLWLHFEDLKENLRPCIEAVAKFMQINPGLRSLDLQTLPSRADLFVIHPAHSKYENAAGGSCLAIGTRSRGSLLLVARQFERQRLRILVTSVKSRFALT